MSRRAEADRSDRSDRPERRSDRGDKRYADPGGRDYGRDPRDSRDSYPTEKPSREPPRDSRTVRDLNEYFVDGQGISRAVLQMDICKYLGPEATSRPGTYHDKTGFFVRAVRAFTPEQLDDLRASSRLYSSETRDSRDRGYQGTPSTEAVLKSKPNPHSEPPYEHSQTRRRLESSMPTSDYYPSSGPSQTAGSPYGAGPSSGYPPTATTYVSSSGFPAYTMTAASGSIPAGPYAPMTGDPRYPGYVYETPMQPGLQGGYSQEYYPQGSAHDPQRRREQLPAGYAYSSSSIQDPRYVVDDRPPPAGYGYEGSYQAAPPGGYAPAPYRGQPSPYDSVPSRDPYGGRPGPAQDPYAGQRRRQ
ncbi:hypothetical protein MMC27_006417 [Xylographa pallens]|nr:hypothetical protein [Xylographa pallens]